MTAFTPGQVIHFCNELLVVVSNYGTSGDVRHLGSAVNEPTMPYRWEFEGERCRLATAKELQPFADRGIEEAKAALAALSN